MFRKGNRDKLEIMSDIISCMMSEHDKITHIMYKCTLSYEQVKKYLTLMIEKGLVEPRVIQELGVIYGHTQKGIEFRRNVLNALEMIQ